jgi:hypothetical protein
MEKELQSEESVERHLTPDELVQYNLDRLDDNQSAYAQYHLLQCDKCLSALKDLREFLKPTIPSSSLPDSAVARDFTAFWAHTAAARMDRQHQGANRATFHRRRPLAVTLTAVFLLVIVTMGGWIIKLEHDEKVLRVALEGERERVAALGNAQRGDASGAGQPDQAPGVQPEKPGREPDKSRDRVVPALTNIPVYNIYPAELRDRSAESTQVNRIKLPSGARALMLLFSTDGLPPSQEYELELVGPKRQIVWRGKGLRRDTYGNLSLLISRTILPKGKSTGKLYGSSESTSVPLAEYVIAID